MTVTRRDFSRSLFGLPLAIGSVSGAASLASDPTVKQQLEVIRAKHTLPALIGGIVTTAGLKSAAVTGVRVAGGKTEATLDDLWHLGSNTKAMTASVMATLVEERKLTWNDDLAKLLPKVPGLKGSPLGAVTVHRLLHHSSGLVANLKWGPIASGGGDMIAQRLRALDEAIQTPLASAPGSTYLYSNTGYVVAGIVMEQLTGKPWEDLMQERLFKPLGMTSAGFGGVGTPGIDDQPWPHFENGTPTPTNGPKVDNPAVMGPAGTVHTTLADWAKFVADHLKGARGQKALLKPASYAALHKPALDAYAMGWSVVDRPWAGGLAMTHTGSNTMNYAVVWLAPKKGFAVIACTNRGLQAQAADEAVGALLKHHQSRP